ncbi:MAG: hypothetical protein E7166_06520 [Firmicutes bacterium]|nr:hypothetical protein [Bacillota bacterium]
MSSLDLLNKYAELTEAWMDKQAKLDNYVQQWLDGTTQMSAEGVQQLVDSSTQQIEQLKASASQAQAEYLRITQEETMRKNAVRSVKHNLGASPDELVINGGVLSSNAKDSYLTGRQKTPEELEFERNQLLANIKSKVMSKEITLAEASKLAQDVNIAYGVNTQIEQENTQGGMRR